jgi:hypothetical protein
MEEQLKKLQAEIDKYEKESRLKELEIKRAKEKAKTEHDKGNDMMEKRYAAEAALKMAELKNICDSSTRIMALRTELLVKHNQMKIDKSVVDASNALSKANKLGGARKTKMEKIVLNAETQFSNIDASASSSTGFIDKRLGSDATMEYAKQILDDFALSDALETLDESKAATEHPPATVAGESKTEDLRTRLDQLKN